MKTTTEQIRDALTARLLELGDTVANIHKVLNPEEARNPSSRPEAGKNYAVLWTLPGALINQRADRIQWQQTFAADLAIQWVATEDMEAKLDKIRLHLAASFALPLTGITCQKQSVQDIEIGYPTEGSQYAVVSVVADYTYIETLTLN